MLTRKGPLQLLLANVPRCQSGFVILKLLLRSALQCEVQVLQAFLVGPPVLSRHTVILGDPVLDVLVGCAAKGCRSTLGDGHVDNRRAAPVLSSSGWTASFAEDLEAARTPETHPSSGDLLGT